MRENFTINNAILISFLEHSFSKKTSQELSNQIRPSRKVIRNIMQYSQSLQVVKTDNYGVLMFHSN